MKSQYWFKRGTSQTKTPERNHHSRGREQENNNQNLIPDDTVRNQLKLTAEKLLGICQNFDKIKKFNETYHQTLVGEDKTVIEVRCIEHNSSIILYCQTDHKLVCSNCVFSSDSHKRHNIIEAAKAGGFVDADIKEAEKVLRVKIGQLLKERGEWGKIIDEIDKNHRNFVASIDQQHESASAILASIYCKNKNKLQEVFHTTKQSIYLIMKAYTNLTKGMTYSHSIPSIRHLYMQQVIGYKVQMERLMPNLKIGQQIIYLLNRFGVNVIKTFKSATSQLFG